MAKKAKYYVRADGLHEAIRTINGKRVAFRGKTDAEVERKMLEYREQQRLGRKFPVVADDWFREHEGEIGQSTYRVYGYALERVKAAFPGYCSEIRPMDVQRYVRDFEKQGYSKHTVQIEISVLNQIFAHAVLSGDIEYSPAREVRKSKGLPCKVRGALTEEQEQKVEACRSGDWWLLGYMLLYTGCRIGELLALEWKDIDRKAGVIHVGKKLNYAYGNRPHLENFVKNKKSHDVPLLPPLAAVLPSNRVGKVFCNANGDYLTSSQKTAVWKAYCKDAGLDEDEPKVTPHVFRHSFATLCYEAGIDVKAAAAFMGDTEAVVSKVYTDLRESRHATAAEQLGAYVTARARAAEGGV